MSDNYQPSTTADTASASAPDEPATADRAPNTLLNALIGGIAGIVLSFIPFSTILGGGIAGYLEGGDATAGARVGALAGVVAFVPFVLIIGVVLFFVPVVSGPGIAVALWVVVLLVVLLALLYTVGLSALGGVLGVYVKEEV